ncbi:MAG: hypothetical protein SFX73_32305 [Kofleriaceae bacterium]|nr:hypothetical protein [Kofleriaceae bacterium]
MRTSAFVLLLGLAAASACKRTDGDPTKVTAASTDDATKPLVDEDYRFEIAWPGDGWKLTREADIRKLVPDAVAGAMDGDALFGAIIVEVAPGSTATEFADLLIEQLPIEGKTVELRERIKYAGVDAERYVVAGRMNGVDFRFANNVFVRDRFVFQVLGWGQVTKLSASAGELKPFFEAFKALPGEIKGRVPAPVTDAHGVGWHVKGGVFESAVTALRARPTNNWRLMVGDPLIRANRDAEVGLAHSNPDVYIALIPERAPPPAQRAAFVERMRSALEGTRGEPYQARFAGSPLEMVSVAATTGVKLQYLHGVHVANDQLVQVQAWFHAADRERALKVLPTGLAAFETMPATEAKALMASFEQRRDTQAAIGPFYALRAGVYRSFAKGWTWKKPVGVWRITTGDEARVLNAEAEISLYEPSKFLYGVVLPQQTTSTAKEFHALALAANPGTKVSEREVGRARVTVLDLGHGATQFRWHVASLVENGLGLQIMFWGQKVDMDAQGALIDAAIAGFSIDKLEATSEANGEYIEHRFGFAVRTPGPGFRFRDQTPIGMDAIAKLVMWERGNSMFGALAVHFPTSQSQPDEKWLLDFLEQILRDRVGKANVPSATKADTMLGGVPGRRLTWPGGMAAYVVLRDSTAYAVLTSGDTNGPNDFRFLD